MSNRLPITQCAAIAYRWHELGLQIVLVTSMDTRRWVLPKGNIEPDMTASESAAQEAYEEAGVEGDIAAEPIGTYEYEKAEDKGDDRRRVAVFPMAVTKIHRKWPEKEQRQRKWMSVEDAVLAVNEKKLKKLLAHFSEALPAPKS